MTLKFTESVQSRLSGVRQFLIVFNVDHRFEFFGLRAFHMRLPPKQHNWLSTMKKATEKIFFSVLSQNAVFFFSPTKRQVKGLYRFFQQSRFH